MRRKLIFIAVALLFLGGAGAIAWTLVDWPPPRLVLKYGIPPYCAPTGRDLEVEGIEFVEIGPGCFRMGSHFLCEEGDLLGRVSAPLGLDWGTPPRHESGECPVHWVEFPRGFWIASTEVTNAQYERFDSDRERSEDSPGDRNPVVDASWEDAHAYCEWLSRKSGLDVRLPSEAEWEAACRAGSEAEYCYGDDEGRLIEYAWFDANSVCGAHDVGTRRANNWGLCDMHGNAWEWCEDTFHQDYENAPANGAAWTNGGELWEGRARRVVRGGRWRHSAELCRSSLRRGYAQEFANWSTSFRPAISNPVK